MTTKQVTKRKLNVRVLPGQPTDGSGKVCVHLFVPDERGLFTEPSVTYLADTDEGKRLSVRPMCGRIACDRKKTVTQKTVKGVTDIIFRTGDPRGVTCSRCTNSTEYVEMMEQLNKVT